MKTALIIGSGLGGLSTALRLSKRGYKVTIVDKFHQAGGRLNQLKKEGYTWDMAPSFFSMTYEFDEFVKDCGIEYPFEFVELDPLYTVNFRGSGKSYKIYKDLEKLGKEFADVEPDFQKKAEKFLASAGSFFHDTEDLVIRKNFNSMAHFLFTLTKVPWKYAPRMLNTIWKELSRYFESREVKEILSLCSFFLGATPYNTPGIYTLLSYTELVHDGYHNVRGGMYQIVEGLLRELEKEGVEIHYNTEIVGYEAQETGLRHFTDQNGKNWEADLFVVNADAAWFRGKILGRKKYSEKKLAKKHWTMAPLTIYIGVKGKVPQLDHHNYFLGDNFKEYASGIFKNAVSLDQPYYYVNVLSRFNPESAPADGESLFILVPVPDLRYKPDWSDKRQIVDRIYADISARIGYDIPGNLVTETILDPADWEKAFDLFKGSGLSLAHDINQIGHFRPRNYDEKFGNVFYVGSSTIPGTGLPMAMISSRLVTERIQKKYGSVST